MGIDLERTIFQEIEKKKNKDMSASIKRANTAGAGAAGGGHVAELANKLGKEGLKVGAGPAKRQDSKPGKHISSHLPD